MRGLRPAWLLAAALLVLVAVIAVSGIRFGDRALFPSDEPDAVPVYVVSNGFNSGLVLPRPVANAIALRRSTKAVGAVMIRFAHYDWVEAGWGDDRFYRDVPTAASFDWRLALRALFRSGNASVLHIVGIEGDPRGVFKGSDLVQVRLSPEGFGRLIERLDHTFARGATGEPEDLGPGLYGPSLFYRATGTFSLFNLCNHWTARMLGVAGVPVWPLLATIPKGLVLDLMLRSGLSRERPPLPVSAWTQ